MEFENLTKEERKLYSEIETQIMRWVNDGTKTAGSLTREIMDLIIVHNSVCHHEPQYQSYNSDTGIQRCDKCGEITN